ncbi:MAG TPA: thioredoxin domain-containing protein [Elusimicrobiota bacterium]|nr:thioredoxin domain-containing protein [Elusimicrobiota bacterium]
MKRIRFLLPLVAVSFLGSPARAGDSRAVAKIGDTTLTEKQMDDELGARLYEAENNLYQVKKGWIDSKAQDILFNQAAKAAGLSRRDWESREIDAKVSQPTMQEIQQFLQRYPPQAAASTETLHQVTEYLAGQKRSDRQNEVFNELQKQNPVKILVKKPEAPHIQVTYAPDDPVKGSLKAPVTIVEFTDFQCPYCKKSQDTLHQVETNYADKVKLVARQYPLPFHNRAKPAAEAAMCAKEQGKYWEYREKLFDKQQLEDADFTRYAQELGMNMPDFQKCLSDHRYAQRIDHDIADGQKFGVQGTPHFFVNGRPISGAQPYSVFQDAIDDELVAAKKKG